MCKNLNDNSSEDFNDMNTPIVYIRKFDEYGLKIFDGGNSYLVINFCPWCGERLPESKRDRWFDEVEALGFDDPFNQIERIPLKYKTDQWYR